MSDIALAYLQILTDLIPHIVIQITIACGLIGLFTKNVRKYG